MTNDQRTLDFSSLEEYLTQGIDPEDLAELLNELAYDYARINIRLMQVEEETKLFIEPQATTFLFHLKQLREALLDC